MMDIKSFKEPLPLMTLIQKRLKIFKITIHAFGLGKRKENNVLSKKNHLKEIVFLKFF